MQQEYLANEQMSFKDQATQEPHGLRGLIQIYRRNKETGEVSFWDESSNVITLSGYQWILMKMMGLFLDSSHGKVTDNLTRDTTLATPDLNEKLKIGVKPENYEVMDDDISVNHICQGFMIGNGGASEDSVTTKNTAYSFVSLRNPIPFQQSASINTSLAGKYLGAYYGASEDTADMIPQSLYIKKFDELPHIYHSWWVDGQRWDYVDPVTQDDLGPGAINGTPKTNRIETYVECKLSLSDTDCQAYFQHAGNNQTAMVNELGLVAFDTVRGERSILETLYDKRIEPMLLLLYQSERTEEERNVLVVLLKEIVTVMEPSVTKLPSKLREFYAATNTFVSELTEDTTAEELETDFTTLQTAYNADTNIKVQAYYNQNGTLQYTEDEFLTLLEDASTSELTLDQAQRIKLITYYTFNSIPITKNWEILINYRIYAN